MSDTVAVAVSEAFDWYKLISPVVSVLVSTLITYLFFRKKRSDDYLSYLDKQLDEILKIAISYPHCEFTDFCDTWSRDKAKSNDDDAIKYLQYNIYANLVFNYISRLSAHYNYNEDKILKHTDIKDWIRIHKKVWKQPLNGDNENIDTYDRKFVELVNRYIG